MAFVRIGNDFTVSAVPVCTFLRKVQNAQIWGPGVDLGPLSFNSLVICVAAQLSSQARTSTSLTFPQ